MILLTIVEKVTDEIVVVVELVIRVETVAANVDSVVVDDPLALLLFLLFVLFIVSLFAFVLRLDETTN